MKNQSISEQLDRILAFYGRLDSKTTALFAIDSSLLGFLATQVERSDFTVWYLAIPTVIFIGALIFSIVNIFICSYPHTKGDKESNIYFKSISSKSEKIYSERMKAMKDSEWESDMISQIWRNSEILSLKYKHLKLAFAATAFALLPWSLTLALVD